MQKLAGLTLAISLLAQSVAAQTIERIKETGELRLGFRTDAAPLSFRDLTGNPAGYSPLVCAGVAQAIANALRMETLDATFIPVTAEDRFERVASGEIDLLCGAATITLRRREIVDFSVPVYVDGTAVLQPRDAVADMNALAGKKVGVRAGTTTQEALTNSLEADGIDAGIVVFDNHQEGLAALERGDIQAYFADQSILFHLVASSKMSLSFKVSDNILTIEKQGLAMARGDADFRLLVDTALTDMFARGEMEQIFLETLPGVTPGLAIRAMHMLSPTLP